MVLKKMGSSQNYQGKLISSENAAKLVKSGNWIDLNMGLGFPERFDEALAKRVNELKNVNIRSVLALRDPKILRANTPEHKAFIWNSWHMSGYERKYLKTGTVFYSPMRFSELPRYYREDICPADIAVIAVPPMDKHGYFSFGASASYAAAVCENAKIIILEVNENQPRCMGRFDDCIHISKVDYVIDEGSKALPSLSSNETSEADRKIAELVIKEIRNGSCLQLGIGGMANAIGTLIAQSDLKDLGVHTEMYVDGFYELYKKGKINGAKKNIDKGKQVFSFAAGSKEMYEFINDNPVLLTAPVDYTNDVNVISSIDNFVSINNALEVDLFGQVNAEAVSGRQISGAGGQLDFIMGAYASKDGQSFICLSSTYTDSNGQLKSKIIPSINAGSIVTDTRANPQWIVTEFGKVNLKGMTVWQRAEALISISHPQFRDGLIKEAEKLKIWNHR